MKKNIVLLFSLLLILNSFATKHNHFDENEVRYIKDKTPLNPQYQEFLRNNSLWQNFRAVYTDWFVIFNERNQLPHRAFGSPIAVNDIKVFLNSQDFILPNDLRVKAVLENDKYINRIYTQYYNNIEVVGSRLYAKFTLNNELISFGLDVFNDINVSITPV